MANCTVIFGLVMGLVMVLLPASAAPRGKTRTASPQTVYDQKQTGDYNIQLHLKDFQIIALLADDSIGGLGDYDYTYDYSDFTVKPATQKPTTDSSTTTDSSKPSSTIKPSNHPYPIILPNTSTEKPNSQELTKPATNQESKPSESLPNEPPTDGSPNINASSLIPILLNNSNETENEKESPVSAALTVPNTTDEQIDEKLEEKPNTPGKIKVQIIETPMAIVPGEELSSENLSNDGLPQGEIMQIRRCSSGYARDKKGRCRKVRRPGALTPQLPFGISRLASNLAARFRHASSESSLPVSDSIDK